MKPSLVLVGLGNHGAAYARTRHNAGYQAIDRLSEEFGEGPWKPSRKFQAQVQEGRIVTVPILLVKPETYMNLSGDCIRKLVDFYKLNPAEQIIVFCDDIDLPLGEVRFRRKGGPGTHNGLKSIVEVLGEGFPRMRIGIGTQPPGADLAAWVLSAITPEEQKNLSYAYDKLPEQIRTFVMEGNAVEDPH